MGTGKKRETTAGLLALYLTREVNEEGGYVFLRRDKAPQPMTKG